MNIDGTFIENEVTAENLSELSAQESLLFERRICELSYLAYEAGELVCEMLRSGYGIYEALSVVSDGIGSSVDRLHDSHLEENYSRLVTHLRFVRASDKVVFSELLLEEINKRTLKPEERDFLIQSTGNGVVAYVKNPLADEAYDVFSQELQDPRLRYYNTLSDAVRSVSLGECQFALLPLEEKGGARLASVLELLFKEDLKINSVTPVFGFEGDADMKYALVSKHFSVPSLESGDDRYLEIRLRADASIPLSELFLASDALNVKIYRVNSISFDTDDGQAPFYSIVFRAEGGDFSGLLLYLTLFSGAYTTIGLYKNLE